MPLHLAPALVGLVLAALPGSPVPVGALLPGTDAAGHSVRLRVDGIRADAGDPSLTVYALSVEDPAHGWVPYCDADAWGSTEAVIVPGSWDLASGRRVDEGGITVACLSGAIGKCVRFGYRPWKTVDGVSLADAHQACVHMVRADYCGDGRPHTQDGTYIHVYDRLGVQVPAPDRPVELEAGWGKDGATWIEASRWGQDLAALVAECPDRLAGRVATPGTHLTGPQILARFPETWIVNDHARDPAERKHLPAGPAAPAR
jgi:hypothetical protein